MINSLSYELGIIDEQDEKIKYISSKTVLVDKKTAINESTTVSNIFSLNQTNNIPLKLNTNVDETLPINSNSKTLESTTNNKTFEDLNCKSKRKNSKNEDSKSINNSIDSLNSTDIYCSSASVLSDNSKTNSNENLNNKKSHKKNKIIKRSIKNAHSLFTEIIVIYPIYLLISISVVILYKYRENNDILNNISHLTQNKDGKWTYKCGLESHNIIHYFIDFILLLIVLIKGRKIVKYNCIFTCTKYITYSSFIALALGPLINV